MPDTLNIPNRAPTLYVIFTAEINPTTVERLTGVMVQAAKRNVEEVYLAMSTPGGQIQSGITLYNTLLAMPFPLKVDSFVERPVRDGPWSARVSGREAPRAVGC